MLRNPLEETRFEVCSYGVWDAGTTVRDDVRSGDLLTSSGAFVWMSALGAKPTSSGDRF
jgi:hypothetical protein